MSIENKLTYLNETKNQIKSALNTPYNVFRDYPTLISKYVKNQPKSIVEGSSAICENAVALPCSIDVNGNSYQETTEGYNLWGGFNEFNTINSTVSYSSKADGTITASGTTGADNSTSATISQASSENLYITLPAGTYTIKCEQATNSMRVQLYSINTSTQLVQLINSTASTFTLSETTNVFARVTIPTSGTTINTTFKIQIENGSTAHPWEPYTNGASPNTEYEQDIEVIGAYNLLNLVDNITTNNGITTTVENETMAFSGKATASWCNLTSASNKMKISLKANKTYTFVRNQSLPLHVVCRLYFEDNTYQTVVIEPNRIYIEFTPTNDVVSCYLYIGGGLVVDTEYSFTNLKYIIYEGNYDANKLCLPYGHIGLMQQNKNMFSLDKAVLKSGSALGVTFEDKKITMITAGGTWSNAFVIFKNPKKNSFIYASADFLETVTASKKGISIYGGNYPEIKDITNLISVMQDVSLNTKKRISSGANTGNYEYIMIRFWDNATATSLTTKTNCVVDNIQMEFGQPTEYEEHKENLIPINLNGNSIAKVGDIKDILNIGLDGSVSIDKKTAKDILNGVTKLFVTKGGTTNNNIFLTNAFNTKIKGPATNSTVEKHLSNYFRGSFSTNYLYSNNVQGSSIISDKVFGIAFGLDTEITTVELANAFLKEHSVEVLAPLQEEYYETIPLPSIKPIELFEGTNVFELVTNLGTTMAVEYIVDAESLTNEITELENAVIELGGTI